jgi:hypothetical protein
VTGSEIVLSRPVSFPVRSRQGRRILIATVLGASIAGIDASCSPRDQPGPRRELRVAAVDGDRVHPQPRLSHPACRWAGGPVRAQADLSHRCSGLHVRFGAVRGRTRRTHSHRCANSARRRRRTDGAAVARTAGLLWVAGLLPLVGLTGDSYTHAEAFLPGYRLAAVICAAMFVSGALGLLCRRTLARRAQSGLFSPLLLGR